MRTLRPLLFFLVVLLAGCESMEERLTPVPPKVQVFTGDQATVLAAALQAFRQLDLRVLHSSAAHIQAASRIHSSEPFGNSRQLVIDVRLNEAGPGKTEVEMSATEEYESQSTGGTSLEAMRDDRFFNTYFATLQQVLAEGRDSTTPEKK